MSLLSIAQGALRRLSGFEVPSTYYGNNNLTAVSCVNLLQEAGNTLVRQHRWQELITEHTFTTTASTATYALPSDFKAFANMSQWDRTNQWRLTGPTPSIVWQWLKSGISVASTNNRWFMVRGNLFTIFPTPSTTGDTIAFDYYSNAWITKQADSTNVTAWTADLDTARIDEELLTLDLKWRFLQAKGMPYEPEYKAFESVKEDLLADNGGRGMINLNTPMRPMFDGNLPDNGFGG
jgi:hypothetical protein